MKVILFGDKISKPELSPPPPRGLGEGGWHLGMLHMMAHLPELFQGLSFLSTGNMRGSAFSCSSTYAFNLAKKTTMKWKWATLDLSAAYYLLVGTSLLWQRFRRHTPLHPHLIPESVQDVGEGVLVDFIHIRNSQILERIVSIQSNNGSSPLKFLATSTVRSDSTGPRLGLNWNAHLDLPRPSSRVLFPHSPIIIFPTCSRPKSLRFSLAANFRFPLIQLIDLRSHRSVVRCWRQPGTCADDEETWKKCSSFTSQLWNHNPLAPPMSLRDSKKDKKKCGKWERLERSGQRSSLLLLSGTCCCWRKGKIKRKGLISFIIQFSRGWGGESKWKLESEGTNLMHQISQSLLLALLYPARFIERD